MRASVVVLGPLLTRCGWARVSMPGGDDFGPRPIDMHLRALEAMGAEFSTAHGNVEGKVASSVGGSPRLVGNRVVLEYPSHTGTDNVLMAAVLAKGTTVIENAAREPEVRDLADFLNAMGARISGAGTSRIEVEGVDRLRAGHPRRHPRPAGGGHLPGGRRHDRGRGDGRGRPARAHGHAAAEADGHRHGDHLRARRPAGVGRRRRPAAVDRRGHPAVPGVRHRLQAAVRHPADRDRGRGDRHREPLLRPVPLRRGAPPHGRRHPHRGPPRRGAGRGAPVRRTGAGLRRPGRRRPGAGRPGGRRRDGHQRRAPHRPRATRTSTASWSPSAPTSSGSDGPAVTRIRSFLHGRPQQRRSRDPVRRRP